MATSITAAKSSRRALLAPTSCAVVASQSITSITRSGTTATVTKTGHGYGVGDWVIHGGATNPYYNGPFQVVTAAANTYTVTLAADPGADAAGTLTAQKVTPATNLWGDGTTPTGSPASVGALTTADDAEFGVRFVNGTSGPGAGPVCRVYTSDTGLPGTWEWLADVVNPSITALADSGMIRLNAAGCRFVLAVAYAVTTNAVLVSMQGLETTYSAA